MILYGRHTIYVDPVQEYLSGASLRKADYILVTHEHQDHFDLSAIEAIENGSTQIISNKVVVEQLGRGRSLANFENIQTEDISIQAFPAYNNSLDRLHFHPEGRDNGYILSLSDTRIYIAGDTEDIVEMKNLLNIDIAFIPVNQPYTMTIDQAVHAAVMINPGILYPYHYGDTDVSALEAALSLGTKAEIRIRNLK